MPMPADQIESLIREGIPDALIEITDLAGDGDHYEARVVAESFRGLPRIKQHQRVYQALGGRMGNELHALKLTTATPD
jgi:stress-induced morphogen